ncbi:MAG: hypothetical protein JNK33_02990 [Candidatus Doudnabacteria bacterium]|nr:hypothetical protein [Candidatus Doudnabacteria bacterium]
MKKSLSLGRVRKAVQNNRIVGASIIGVILITVIATVYSVYIYPNKNEKQTDISSVATKKPIPAKATEKNAVETAEPAGAEPTTTQQPITAPANSDNTTTTQAKPKASAYVPPVPAASITSLSKNAASNSATFVATNLTENNLVAIVNPISAGAQGGGTTSTALSTYIQGSSQYVALSLQLLAESLQLRSGTYSVIVCGGDICSPAANFSSDAIYHEGGGFTYTFTWL